MDTRKQIYGFGMHGKNQTDQGIFSSAYSNHHHQRSSSRLYEPYEPSQSLENRNLISRWQIRHDGWTRVQRKEYSSRSPYSFSSNSSRGFQEFVMQEHRFSQIQRNVHRLGYVTAWQGNNSSQPFNRSSLETIGFLHNRKYLPRRHNQRSNFTGDNNHFRGHEAGSIKKPIWQGHSTDSFAKVHRFSETSRYYSKPEREDRKQTTQNGRHSFEKANATIRKQGESQRNDEVVRGFEKDKHVEKLDGKDIMSAISTSLCGTSAVKMRHEHKQSLVLRESSMTNPQTAFRKGEDLLESSGEASSASLNNLEPSEKCVEASETSYKGPTKRVCISQNTQHNSSHSIFELPKKHSTASKRNSTGNLVPACNSSTRQWNILNISLGPSEMQDDTHLTPSCKMSTNFSSPVLLQQNDESSQFCSNAQLKGQNQHRTLLCMTDARKTRCREKFLSMVGKTESLCHSIDSSNKSLDELNDGMKTSLMNDESKKWATPAAMLTAIEKTVSLKDPEITVQESSVSRDKQKMVISREGLPSPEPVSLVHSSKCSALSQDGTECASQPVNCNKNRYTPVIDSAAANQEGTSHDCILEIILCCNSEDKVVLNEVMAANHGDADQQMSSSMAERSGEVKLAKMSSAESGTFVNVSSVYLNGPSPKEDLPEAITLSAVLHEEKVNNSLDSEEQLQDCRITFYTASTMKASIQAGASSTSAKNISSQAVSNSTLTHEVDPSTENLKCSSSCALNFEVQYFNSVKVAGEFDDSFQIDDKTVRSSLITSDLVASCDLPQNLSLVLENDVRGKHLMVSSDKASLENGVALTAASHTLAASSNPLSPSSMSACEKCVSDAQLFGKEQLKDVNASPDDTLVAINNAQFAAHVHPAESILDSSLNMAQARNSSSDCSTAVKGTK